jgi:hypothetical protein
MRSTLLPLLALAACTPYGLVGNERRTVEGAVSIEPGIAWNKVRTTLADGWEIFSTAPVERWTIDDERLEMLTFYAGIADGEPLMRIPDEKDRNQPAFRAGMTPSEIADLFEGALSRSTRRAIPELRNLRPAMLGGVPGFRFELSYSLSDEVDRELAAAGAVRNGKLYLVTFQGTRLYHFPKYLPEFERILATWRFVCDGANDTCSPSATVKLATVFNFSPWTRASRPNPSSLSARRP